MADGDSMWSRKGATMSDKSARQEFGLTQQEIIAAIRAGKLQFRESNLHGNPWYRLLRHEVESLVRDKSGLDHLTKKKLQKELADLNTEARKLTTRLKAIERRRTELMKEIGGGERRNGRLWSLPNSPGIATERDRGIGQKGRSVPKTEGQCRSVFLARITRWLWRNTIVLGSRPSISR